MIARGFAASVAVAAALLIGASVSAANTHVSAPQHQQHAKATVPQAKQTRQMPSTDVQHPDAAQPAAQPNRTVIVGVGTLVMSRQREFRDIAMAPTG